MKNAVVNIYEIRWQTEKNKESNDERNVWKKDGCKSRIFYYNNSTRRTNYVEFPIVIFNDEQKD